MSGQWWPASLQSLQDIKDSRKTAVINDELRRLNVDIATLQETRLSDSGTLKEKDYTFFWQGKRSDEPREHAVGFAVRNSLLKTVEPGSSGSERFLTLRYNSTTGPDHSLVCCKIRMQPQGSPRIDVSKMSQPDLMEQFAQTFEK